ncbi:MAG TPA: hypothetical protein VJ782_09480 [Aeromicrobium sp.]|nr:hypothetical protein [Aeromicrobium sp.]
MRILARSTILTTISLAAAGLVLTACGPDPGESESPNTEDDHATGAPTETIPTTAGIPTNASVQAFCEAFKGGDTTLAGVNTTGEAADAYEDLLDNQREVGTPANMPQETQQVFIAYMQTGADFVAALRRLPEDSPVSKMRTDKEFYEAWGGKLETPKELRDYADENCR